MDQFFSDVWAWMIYHFGQVIAWMLVLALWAVIAGVCWVLTRPFFWAYRSMTGPRKPPYRRR